MGPLRPGDDHRPHARGGCGAHRPRRGRGHGVPGARRGRRHEGRGNRARRLARRRWCCCPRPAAADPGRPGPGAGVASRPPPRPPPWEPPPWRGWPRVSGRRSRTWSRSGPSRPGSRRGPRRWPRTAPMSVGATPSSVRWGGPSRGAEGPASGALHRRCRPSGASARRRLQRRPSYDGSTRTPRGPGERFAGRAPAVCHRIRGGDHRRHLPLHLAGPARRPRGRRHRPDHRTTRSTDSSDDEPQAARPPACGDPRVGRRPPRGGAHVEADAAGAARRCLPFAQLPRLRRGGRPGRQLQRRHLGGVVAAERASACPRTSSPTPGS